MQLLNLDHFLGSFVVLISSVSLFKAAEPKLTENAMVLYGLAYIFYNLCLPPTFPLSGP
jgi:hypothetical protein